MVARRSNVFKGANYLMAEREATRERPLETQEVNHYESIRTRLANRREIGQTGRIVIKRSELNWQEGRQGLAAFYMIEEFEDIALRDWRVFAHEIGTHSGRHTHQGGIVLYVTKGRGYTTVNGQKKHWKAGDLLLLPILPGGVEHQHWNEDPDEPSEWVAFRFVPWQYATGAQMDHKENSPNWRDEG